MFYHVKPSVIPDSRFKRIVNVTRNKILLLSGFFILWILSVLTLFKFGYIEKLNPNGWTRAIPISWITLISSIIFFIGIGLFIKSVYRLLSNSKINKLNIKGELELGEAGEKSVFNQHLEGILYFFERTSFNVVIIEDVDRFNSTDIFTKLREINILINNSNLIKRPIKFIYAIKDEMFLDKNERVKFFEFIIPVIPFINPSNANEQLAKLIAKANLQGVLSSDFTSDVVTFIDDIDMRLLINIFHEYQIYRSVLGISLKQDNLFSILVYKNMYPDDFGELPKRRGKLYRFFANKKIYTKDLRQRLITKIEDIDAKIELLESEINKPVKELRAVYINTIVSKLDKFSKFYSGTELSIVEAVEDEYFNELKKDIKIQYTKYEASYNSIVTSNVAKSNLKLSDIEKEVSPDLTYLERERLLIDNNDHRIETLKAEREKIKNEVVELESRSIQEIFSQVDVGSYLGEFENSYLMKNLLLNGYINEYYEDYISLFHEVNLTKEDFAFERSVKSGESPQFEYKLVKIENLVKRIPEKYFKREAILNYTVFEYLLNNEEKHKSKLEAFYTSLSVDGEKQFRFIHGFIKTHSLKTRAFINQLCYYKSDFWRFIFNESGLPSQEIRSLVKLIFEHGNIKDILQFEDIASLIKYFEQIPDLFNFSAIFENLSNVKEFIIETKLRFKNLDVPLAGNDFFYFIYINNYYEINKKNIVAIIKGNGKDINEEKFEISNYTTISKIELKELVNYINSNLEAYISNVLTLLNKNTREEEQAIINILNKENVLLSSKAKVLKNQESGIQSLSNIDDIHVKRLVLILNKIIPSWVNVFDYYDATEEIEFDDTLVIFLNDPINYEVLAKEKLNITFDKDDKYFENIVKNILYCKTLSLTAYAKLLDSIPYVYKDMKFDGLQEGHINSLLKKKILILSDENFKGLKAENINLSLRLI